LPSLLFFPSRRSSDLTEWVTQIVVLIFIGTILDLIIPNQSMKRYVHIVVGLTLLLILIKPILFVFQEHIPSAISKIETAIEKQEDRKSTRLNSSHVSI